MFTVHVDFDGAEAILARHGLDKGGRVQRFFSSEILRISDPYVPFQNGILAASGRVADSGDAVIYNTPYAHYHYIGKLYVDPVTKKGAFYDSATGRFWSRPNVQKEPTARALQYQGAPRRGARWVERAWLDRKDEVLASVERYANGGE